MNDQKELSHLHEELEKKIIFKQLFTEIPHKILICSKDIWIFEIWILIIKVIH